MIYLCILHAFRLGRTIIKKLSRIQETLSLPLIPLKHLRGLIFVGENVAEIIGGLVMSFCEVRK